MGALSPLGTTWDQARDKLQSGVSGVSYHEEWEEYEGIEGRIAGKVRDEELDNRYPRKKTRSMGRVALLAVRATELALREAGLLDSDVLSDGSTGVAFGSTAGNEDSSHKFFNQLKENKTIEGIKSVDFLKLMSHTCPASIGQFFDVNGRMITTCSACTSGSQGIGYGYESIKHGQQAVMITGGADELVVAAAAVFNILFAASTNNDDPESVPRPFDTDRDGLVVGEGAGTLVLESLEHARDRGAPIFGEVLGYGTNINGGHPTIPSGGSMGDVLRLALDDAGLTPDQIDYVNAHATATDEGDQAESEATGDVMGNSVPVSSLKGHMGHTLGACGAVEAIYGLRMLKEGWVSPTLNLEEPDPSCRSLNYVMGNCREMEGQVFMSNNFAFGGVNTSLIMRSGEVTLGD
jgi:3-oxoacyl-[acyl-carrier-protein] synthase II